MSYVANILTVLIASPGDVADERDIATEEIHRWNAANSAARQIFLFPLKWETHSSPRMGTSPQSVLNEQLLAYADIVIGIFGTRVGTATTDYISGSVEEIKRHVAAGKLAMVYFSRVPIDPNRIDHAQWEGLQSFKEECRTGGLYHEYISKEQFMQDFGHHLSIELNKPKYAWLQRPQLGSQQDVSPPTLSALERDLLVAMSNDANGFLVHSTTMEGYSASANDVSFGDGTPRGTAALKRSIARLADLGFIDADGDEIYEMTVAGFARADEEAANQQAQSPPTLREKASELLLAGIAGRGNILHRIFIGGEGIDAGGKSFMTGNPREDSEWREALQELIAKELIQARSKSLYELTAAGFRVGDELTPPRSEYSTS